MRSWAVADLPKGAVAVDEKVAYSWGRCEHVEDVAHIHTIDCLWVWHDCDQTLGAETVAPGQRFGWRPAGVSAHTLISIEPLHLEASVYWPDCCGMHGFIRDGRWVSA